MNFERLQQILSERSEPAYRMKQIKQAVFVNLISSWEEATNLGKDLREALKKDLPVSSVRVAGSSRSKNSPTEKVLFELADGEKIESVLIQSDRGRTVCVSSQAGCSLSCAFCATGRTGCKRNLTAEEIVDQVMYFARALKSNNQRVTNVVAMGMGEPFLNYDNVLKALRTLNDPDGLNLGARNMSVSTSGIIPGIQRFAYENFQVHPHTKTGKKHFGVGVNLAISLHAPNDELRSELMPINRKYHLKDLMAAVGEYVKLTNRKVFFEYLLINGVNDSVKNAEELAGLMKENRIYHVNLIKYHATYGKFKPSPYERRENFKKILEKHKIPITFRVSFGEDISAACGQLVVDKK